MENEKILVVIDDYNQRHKVVYHAGKIGLFLGPFFECYVEETEDERIFITERGERVCAI